MRKLVLFVLPLFLFACNRETEINEGQAACWELHNLMKEWYLWNDNIPEIDPLGFSDPKELMTALRYNPLDKWSNVNQSLFISIGQADKYITGHGIRLALDQNNDPRVVSIYHQSDLYTNGVRRGWIVKTINGITLAPVLSSTDPDALNDLLGGSSEGTKNVFELTNPEGNSVRLESTQTTFDPDAVMMCDTLHLKTGITGYLVLDSFYDALNAELSEALTWLRSCGITDLIVDLRYNNEGFFTSARTLASAIAGNSHSGTQWLKIIYNEEKAKTEDNSFKFITTNFDLSPERVVFITTGSTSSGSELVISGLKPFTDVTVVGSRSSGNPSGIYSFMNTSYSIGDDIIGRTFIFHIVACEFRNTTDTRSWYDGLDVDIEAADDITHDFGERNESSLAAAIAFLEGNGAVKSAGRSSFHPLIFNEGSGRREDATILIP